MYTHDEHQILVRSSPRRLSRAAGIGLGAILFTGLSVWSRQEDTPSVPPFEAASVKPNRSGEPSLEFRITPGRLAVRNADLKNIIKNAFGIRQDSELAGGPRWIETERYDIVATAPNAASHEQVLSMLQTLLAERFQLSVHREQRSGQVYKLTIANSGPKLQALKPGIKPRSPSPNTRIIGVFGGTAGLARALSRLLGHEVIDETGLTGRYDLSIEIARDDPASPAFDAGRGPDAPSGPSIFAAVEEQLGLKLKGEKATVSVLVIDKVERPTPN
jgi:uncharacterized protein (TIGR03435 family)